MIGTTIGSLNNEQQLNDPNYQNYQNHSMRDTPQNIPKYDPRFFQQQQDRLDIEELARDINESLPREMMEDISSVTQEDKSIDSSQFVSGVFDFLKDPLIILVIYVILSQAIVKETIGKYINQINPNSEGQVSFTGVVIYGIILAALFVLVKRFT